MRRKNRIDEELRREVTGDEVKREGHKMEQTR
jgi:hypothetical protein